MSLKNESIPHPQGKRSLVKIMQGVIEGATPRPEFNLTVNVSTEVRKPTFFNFDAQAVRSVIVGGNAWFVAKDVCAALEIGGNHVSQAVAALDDDEKGNYIVVTLGGPQSLLCVNESGLYALIFRSRKASARLFRKWVTAEVLPTIRRTGGYVDALMASNWQAQLQDAKREIVELRTALAERLSSAPAAAVLSPAERARLYLHQEAEDTALRAWMAAGKTLAAFAREHRVSENHIRYRAIKLNLKSTAKRGRKKSA